MWGVRVEGSARPVDFESSTRPGLTFREQYRGCGLNKRTKLFLFARNRG